jgi:hypothetical protein
MTSLMALTTCDYDSTMGVGVLDDSPILKPQDLVGKRVASVPTSATYVETTDPVMRYLTELGAKRTRGHLHQPLRGQDQARHIRVERCPRSALRIRQISKLTEAFP